MILQRLKPLHRWTIALIVSGIAVTGGSLYYSISEFGQKPVEPVAPAPSIQPITALGRLEPASEVVRVAAPATLVKLTWRRLALVKSAPNTTAWERSFPVIAPLSTFTSNVAAFPPTSGLWAVGIIQSGWILTPSNSIHKLLVIQLY